MIDILVVNVGSIHTFLFRNFFHCLSCLSCLPCLFCLGRRFLFFVCLYFVCFCRWYTLHVCSNFTFLNFFLLLVFSSKVLSSTAVAVFPLFWLSLVSPVLIIITFKHFFGQHSEFLSFGLLKMHFFLFCWAKHLTRKPNIDCANHFSSKNGHSVLSPNTTIPIYLDKDCLICCQFRPELVWQEEEKKERERIEMFESLLSAHLSIWTHTHTYSHTLVHGTAHRSSVVHFCCRVIKHTRWPIHARIHLPSLD